MGRALEGAIIDTAMFQQSLKVLEEKMNGVLIADAVIVDLTGLVWLGNPFKVRKKHERKRERES